MGGGCTDTQRCGAILTGWRTARGTARELTLSETLTWLWKSYMHVCVSVGVKLREGSNHHTHTAIFTPLLSLTDAPLTLSLSVPHTQILSHTTQLSQISQYLTRLDITGAEETSDTTAELEFFPPPLLQGCEPGDEDLTEFLFSAGGENLSKAIRLVPSILGLLDSGWARAQ